MTNNNEKLYTEEEVKEILQYTLAVNIERSYDCLGKQALRSSDRDRDFIEAVRVSIKQGYIVEFIKSPSLKEIVSTYFDRYKMKNIGFNQDK